MRVPMGALYIDEVRDLAIGSGLALLNAVPGDAETDVAHDQLLHFRLVSIDDVNIDSASVYIIRSSDQVRRLAYSMAGGFAAPYNGSASLATQQSSPGATALDELILCLDFTGDYTSLETVLVEIEATSAAPATFYTSYSFTIEDLTAPHLDEILWLSPRRCRVKWSEPVSQLTTPGGALFVEFCSDAVEILPTVDGAAQGSPAERIRMAGLAPAASWIGYSVCLMGSAYPENNKVRPITAVDVSTKAITLDTSGSYGAMRSDDGNDWDMTEQGGNAVALVRRRKIQASVSPYSLAARLSEEGLAESALSAERVQCAYCPIPTTASTPLAEELPAGEDPEQYTVIDWHDDVSFGRLYTIYADGVGDVHNNLCVDSELDHQTPWFGSPTDRIKLWANGLLPPPSKAEDLARDQLLRKLSVVMQDVLNCLWYRVDQLQFMRDPGRCDDALVDFLLYEIACPFRFPATDAQKRLLISALPDLYKQLGTTHGIEEFLFRLLNIQFDIVPYVGGDFWTLGVDQLGRTTILGPSGDYARNSYEIVSPVTLTDEEERIVTDVATWADPFNMHLARIVEPGMAPGTGTSYWTLGVSSLGVSTVLGGT